MKKQRLFALVLVLVLLGSLSLSASADAYIPPERIDGFDMNYAYMENGTCSALNTFLSNFVEMNMKSYSQDTRDEAVIAHVLKHLEINAGYYPADVKKTTGDDGKTYMKISESIFEKRMQRLFGKPIPAAQCPGYENGTITVTADHFGGPITVFASVYGCYPMGGDVYEVLFEAYRVDVDFSGWYSTAFTNLPWEKLTLLGGGSALIKYAGGKTDDTISTADFSLIEFTMEADGIPCTGANVPYNSTEETQPPETEAVTEPETAPETEPATEPETMPEKETLPENRKKDMDEEEEKAVSNNAQPQNFTMILVIILVGAVVLLALILLFFFVILKKRG